MSQRRELLAFAAALSGLLAAFLGESLVGGKVLSPADVLFVSRSFGERGGPLYEPHNRLLMDPVLQFQPWLEFNRKMLRSGRLPLWNSHAGCGAPHLANGQSAVFDPFHLIAYVGRLPEAHAWMAAARLLAAGLGAFVLARSWGFGVWGRWFAGLTFPFCGFVIVWLLYPVTSSAVWLPWLLWASDRALERPSARSVASVGLFAGFTLLGGHVQTSAHVLLASGLYCVWRAIRGRPEITVSRGVPAWVFGISLGVALAAIEVVPLGFYLAKSPVWEDRARETVPPWRLARPRWLNAVGIALPYAFGSQRRGHPNLARAVGAHNLNEIAGGFAGLATLVWLAPWAWSARGRRPRVEFLAGLAVIGALGAFALPPVDNVLRALPVLNVTDNRRLCLWIAFSLAMLGGIGLDELARWRSERRAGAWIALWLLVATGLVGAAGLTSTFKSALRVRALKHYASAAKTTPGADLDVYRRRAERQVAETLRFWPAYLTLNAAELAALAALAGLLHRGRLAPNAARAGALLLVLFDLFAFGRGLNPSIPRDQDRPPSALMTYLGREVGPRGRILGLGEELPPNTLMRYGLSDVRNYDSVELARSLKWFEPLYEPGARSRSSRGTITWPRIMGALERLRAASVLAVVGPSPPPQTLGRVERVGGVWVARLDGRPKVSVEPQTALQSIESCEGYFSIKFESKKELRVTISETFDPGWKAEADGILTRIRPQNGVFIAVDVPAGTRRLTLRYAPEEVRVAGWISVLACIGTVFGLTGFGRFRSTRILPRGLGRTQAAGLESTL